MFLERRPGPRLRPFIASLWLYAVRLPHGLERVLPDGKPQLLVNLEADTLGDFEPGGTTRMDAPGAVLRGPADRPTTVDTRDQRRVVGVAFRPGGAQAFLRSPVGETRNGLVPLELVWGRDGAVLRERLLDAGSPDLVLTALEHALVERCLREAPDPLVARAAALLDGGTRVRDVTDALGVTRRRLADRLEAGMGLRPKQLSRIRRFQRVLSDASRTPSPPWAAVAAAYGYADQSHLVREFRAFSGMTPSQYRPRGPGESNHVVWTPSAEP